jgi:predicted esterase
MVISAALAVVLAAAAAQAPEVAGAVGPPRGRLVEGVACASDPTQSYTLYLPDGYDPARRWPVLVVLDPGGRSVPAAELFLEPARELQWIIVSSNDTRSDSGMEPNQRALNALWPEIHERYAIDTRRIYLAGFSGTVYVAFMVGRETGGIAGIIGAGGRFIEEALAGNRAAVFLTAGDRDFNYQGTRAVHARMRETGAPSRLETFAGGHGWMPPALARQALEWLELQAMRRGLRQPDDGLVDRLLAADLASAAALEAEGRKLEAMRRYQAVALDFDGLRDVAAARARWESLEADPEVERAASLEARWTEREQQERERINQVFARFLATEPAPPPETLANDLELARLEHQAEGEGIEAATARRVLAHLFSNVAVYMPQGLLADHRPSHAASALGVACRIQPDNPVVWYNRACALSLSGRRSPALDALERAVQAGFVDAALMRTDPDLEAVRDSDRFRALLVTVEQR